MYYKNNMIILTLNTYQSRIIIVNILRCHGIIKY